MVDLPRPDVRVNSDQSGSEKKVDVTISRPQGPGYSPKERTYQGTGVTGDAATKQVIENILNDPQTAEDIGHGR